MKFCSECGRELDVNEEVCTECGSEEVCNLDYSNIS